MSTPELNELRKTNEHKMDGALTALDHNFQTVRTGRANPAVLDNVKVDAYGSEMPLKQMANISTPDARSILIAPWDRNMVKHIEHAIIAANLGFNPNSDGTNVRIIVPPMSEERRKEMTKMAHKFAEDARIAIRHVRKHAMDTIKKLETDHKITEDQKKTAEKSTQELTDSYIKRVDEKLKKKEKEIMEV